MLYRKRLPPIIVKTVGHTSKSKRVPGLNVCDEVIIGSSSPKRIIAPNRLPANHEVRPNLIKADIISLLSNCSFSSLNRVLNHTRIDIANTAVVKPNRMYSSNVMIYLNKPPKLSATGFMFNPNGMNKDTWSDKG
jgi:hypothetical protein